MPYPSNTEDLLQQIVDNTAGGGGGGRTVTVDNFPDDFPDGAANTKLIVTNGLLGEMLGAQDFTNETLGQGGTTEISTIPDSPAAGSGLRKIGFRILQFITGINDFLTTMQPDTNAIRLAVQAVLRTRDEKPAPVAIASGSIAGGTALGGIFDCIDAAGVDFIFATTGNSGSGVQAYVSPNNTVWYPIGYHAFQSNPVSESILFTQGGNGNSLNTYNRIFVTAQMRYVKLETTGTTTIAANAFAQKVMVIPPVLLRTVYGAATLPVSIASNVNVAQSSVFSFGIGHNSSSNTITSTGTTLLSATGIYGSCRNFLFQKGTVTTLTATIQCSIDNATWFTAGTLVIGDFDSNGDCIKTFDKNTCQHWRLNISVCTGGAITFRGVATGI